MDMAGDDLGHLRMSLDDGAQAERRMASRAKSARKGRWSTRRRWTPSPGKVAARHSSDRRACRSVGLAEAMTRAARKVVDHVVDRTAGGHPGRWRRPTELLPLIVITRYEIDRYLQPFERRSQQVELLGSAVVGEIAVASTASGRSALVCKYSMARSNLVLASTNRRMKPPGSSIWRSVIWAMSTEPSIASESTTTRTSRQREKPLVPSEECAGSLCSRHSLSDRKEKWTRSSGGPREGNSMTKNWQHCYFSWD